ncbi:ATP-dependent helicase [Hoyosella sp. G463]|uniref:DNA 3'-5' helicase n=1 Tax=Lolliginicoccus lacisalsi TaxID=2742202 RepID=A0A927JDI3_9ACTN|nr:ATP-dependent DNA helicase [Lolliginicoccus lacisalsi]MBD8506657.1 ATP-dependent helicase [Lolliginicoccus lacisalsi]
MAAKAGIPDGVRLALVQARPRASGAREWPGAAGTVLAAIARTCQAADGASAGQSWHPYQVLGGPGTGKSSLIADLVVEALRGGADPESILVLVPSKHAAGTMRDAISEAIVDDSPHGAPRASREPLVRTVHSYAFAVLALHASLYGNPPPRLITSSEQDAVMRELLRGDIEDDAQYWPPELRPALGLDGFASELRDLVRRAGERGLGPEDLSRLGKSHKRPAWVAAGWFATVYEQVMMLRGSVGMEAPQATAPALDAAELVSAAVTALASDADLLDQERARVRHLFVDDAQHLDPQAAQLVELIGTGTRMAVLTGDPDQGIYRFRGADTRFLEGLAGPGSDRRVLLGESFRMPAAIAGVAARISARIPGSQPHRAPGSRHAVPGHVVAEIVPTQAREAALIADALRRAHLMEGIAWSDMAVVVRSVPTLSAPLRRALVSAGVPVTTPVPEHPLAIQRASQAMLVVARAAARRGAGALGAEDALLLLTGPIGGADPLLLRRVRRGARRAEMRRGGERDSAELLALLLTAEEDDEDAEGLRRDLTRAEAAPINRVRAVLRRARRAERRGRGVEDVLWEAWSATGLQQQWLTAALRGSAAGAQADRDLDAIVALFDAAASYVDRLPGGSLAGFVEHVEQQQIAAEPFQQSQLHEESVTLLSAHAAAGREWDVVAVAGVQEGTWPSLRGRSSLLGAEDLDDILEREASGEPEAPLSRLAPLLADERKLFLVACSRARRTLLVTAVESITGDADLAPSRFLLDLQASLEPGEPAMPEEPDLLIERPARTVLALPALVARLRSVACSPHEPAQRKEHAAAQLARLAAAGVPGADPKRWYGLARPSTSASLWEPADGPVPLSPSSVEELLACPLRWLLTKHGGTDSDTLSAIKGTLVHTLAQAVAGRIPDEEIAGALERAWQKVNVGAPWFARHELARMEGMLDNFRHWLQSTRRELTEAGVEVVIDGVLPGASAEDGAAEGPDVRLRGRIDRLERDTEGRPVVVDIKTARTPISAGKAAEHAQLATYQVAARSGLIPGEDLATGGARLLYIAQSHRTTGAAQRAQDPLDDESWQEWTGLIRQAASATQGPVFEARINDGCDHCPVRSSCPVQEEGRQVTEP